MNELFQRPANYWLRHADRHKQSGDLIRAAVLQRHAVRAEPGSDAARMQYALTLRQLHCYEASTREAFCALAQHPEQTELYGLIGSNMIAMGLRQEGLDALGYYLRECPTTAAPWHDEACDLSEAYDYPFPDRRRKARLDGLLRIAARRIARGELDGAGKALKRSQQSPYRAPCTRRDVLLAAYHIQRKNPGRALFDLSAALEKKRCHVPTMASAAALSHQLGGNAAAWRLLFRAAVHARVPAHQQLVCHTAAAMDMVCLAHGMLKRELSRRADRCPVLYDLCVCALKMGRLQEAAGHIHLCREIDPDDIPSERLFQQVMDWQQQGITPDALRKAARDVSFFGSCTASELADYARPFWEVAERGPAAMAEAISGDDRLRRRLLFLLTLPVEWPVMLLGAACTCLPGDKREALLREVLLQHPADSPAKRYAMSQLRRDGAPAPYACWSHDRFVLVDPDRLYAPVPTFRQRFLTRRIGQIARLCGPGSIPWLLRVVCRMPHAVQSRLISDHWKVWPLALAMRFRAANGLAPLNVPVQTLSPLRLAALKAALKTLHQIDI